MKTLPLIAILGTTLAAGLASAGTTTCKTADGTLVYTTYIQDGGPCCGRSTSQLTYRRKGVKDTLDVQSHLGSEGIHTDTNPNLKVIETRTSDETSTTEGHQVLTYYSAWLDLARTDGKPVLPGLRRSEARFDVDCTGIRDHLPPRPIAPRP